MTNQIIGVKLADGSFYPVLTEGEPAKKVLELTTVRDGQTAVQVNLYRSPTASMEDAEYVDTLLVENLAAHEKEEPTLSLVIGIDENGTLSADVTDRESGRHAGTKVSLVSLAENDLLSPPDYEVTSSSEQAAAVQDLLSGGSMNDAVDLAGAVDLDDAVAVDSDTAIELDDAVAMDDAIDIDDATVTDAAGDIDDITLPPFDVPEEESAGDGDMPLDDNTGTVLSDELDMQDEDPLDDILIPDDTATSETEIPSESSDLLSDSNEIPPESTGLENTEDESSFSDIDFETSDINFDFPESDAETAESMSDDTAFPADDAAATAENDDSADSVSDSSPYTALDAGFAATDTGSENTEDTASFTDADFEIPETDFASAAEEPEDTATDDAADDFSFDVDDMNIPFDDDHLFDTDAEAENGQADTANPVSDKSSDTEDRPLDEPALEEADFPSFDDIPVPDDFGTPDGSPDTASGTDDSESTDSLFDFDDTLDSSIPSPSISFSDLYDEERIKGDDEMSDKKSSAAAVICIICAAVSVAVLLIILFLAPGYLISWKKSAQTDTESATAQTMPQVIQPEPAENADAEPEQPEAGVPEADTAKPDEVVVVQSPVVEPAPVQTVSEKTEDVRYRIKWGDTLWDLSETYYRNPWEYNRIAKFNRIKNPDLIISGTYITIPAK